MPKAKTTQEPKEKPRRPEEEPRDRETHEDHGSECPFCAAMGVFSRRKSRHPDFFGHLRQAETEVLKAFRSLIDDRLEECQEEDQPRKATKIKVT
jgi:hypothetical protein